MTTTQSCPFCGGPATVETTVNGELVFIRCQKCPAQMGNGQRGWKKPESATEWWNRRFHFQEHEVLPEKP